LWPSLDRDILVATEMAWVLRHPYVLHLRLGFNLLLSPVYLWGVFLSGGEVSVWRFWLGYLSLHLFLYGGTTAFNSFYDRDDGPVGGMLRPPAVDAGLLRFSLLMQMLGLVPAAALGWPFLLAWLALFLVFTAYSHPLIRLKARAGAALSAIAVGQGGLGFALGWLAAAPAATMLSAAGLAGALATALVVTGLYLVSQSYQAHEDAARGDLTVAVLLGARRSLRLALLPLATGGAVVIWWVEARLGTGEAAVLAVLFALQAIWLLLWARRFEDAEVELNFRVAMRFTGLASAGLSLFLVLHLLL
jgi:4-hydroxybenzoate polyprenyltransferase